MVLEAGLDPGYVLDRMEMYEVRIVLDNLWRKNREAWERTRREIYTIAQVNSKRTLNPRDLLPFPWDERGMEASASMSDEERERLRRKSMEFIRQKQENHAYGSDNKVDIEKFRV